jgi:hypothetical protein
VATGEPGIRIAIHDASRFEWVTAVPLPASSKERQPFGVEFELEVPAQLFVPQDHWRSLQVMSRLQSPTDRVDSFPDRTSDHDISADRLREVALALSHRVKTQREAFARECFLANCLLSRPPTEHLAARLLAAFQAAEKAVLDTRSKLEPTPTDSAEIAQERALAAEFVSNQLLEFLFHARRAIDGHLLRSDGPQTAALTDTATLCERAIQSQLQREICYRTEHGFVTPTSDEPAVLEHYLERASQLKKHFHELLFLAAETCSVEAQLRSYGMIVGAMSASVFGFILNKTGVLGQSASLGLVVAALVGAVVYALQDKIKELGKSYLPSKLVKRYAQRTTRLIVPPRGDRSDSKLVSTIDESVTAKLHSRPDPLNPELGACRAVHVVRYTSRGISQVQPDLRGRGICSLKQIFRYDLTWLFARLDDARKAVPVLSPTGLRVAEAPRCYRMPVRVKLVVGDGVYERGAVVVMHKGGLERLELDSTSAAQNTTTAHAAA